MKSVKIGEHTLTTRQAEMGQKARLKVWEYKLKLKWYKMLSKLGFVRLATAISRLSAEELTESGETTIHGVENLFKNKYIEFDTQVGDYLKYRVGISCRAAFLSTKHYVYVNRHGEELFEVSREYHWSIGDFTGIAYLRALNYRKGVYKFWLGQRYPEVDFEQIPDGWKTVPEPNGLLKIPIVEHEPYLNPTQPARINFDKYLTLPTSLFKMCFNQKFIYGSALSIEDVFDKVESEIDYTLKTLSDKMVGSFFSIVKSNLGVYGLNRVDSLYQREEGAYNRPEKL